MTCSGTTTAVGTAFGTGTEDNLTINVQTAATVSGTGAGGNGFNIRNNDTVNNSGTVSGTDQGILGGSNLVVNNSLSTSSIVGTNLAGIKAASINVTNFGSITGGAVGVASTVGMLTIDNRSGATISGTSQAATAAAGALVTNAGTISSTGTSGFTLASGDSSFINSGTITSAGNSGFGIFSQGSGTVTVSNNGGTISNTGTGGFGILSTSGNINITSNSGTIQGAVAIQGGATITVNNVTGGKITGLASEAIGTSGTVNLTNAGTVSGTNATTISAGVANITNSGTISGSNFALGTIFVSNSGSIINNLVNGNITAVTGTATQTDAIFASLTTVTVNNSGTIQATGTNAIGIVANGMTVTNNAGATISGTLDGVNMQAGLTSSIANTGTISGAGRSGLRLGSNASVTNTGTGLITGATGIVFRDPTGTNTAVVNGSVFNSGTITGTGGTAINFAATPGSGPFTLTLGPGSIINGNVLGTGGDLFQLGGIGSDTFNASNIGAAQQYRGFTTFNKIGASTWTLTGSGAQNWTISQGTLIGDTNSLAGSAITNNAALVYSQTFNGVYSGVISGSGSLTKSGSGTVILAGDNLYSGGTTISGGTLQLGNGGTTGSILGNVTDNAVLAINHSNAFTFGNVISGTGAFQQVGTGTTTLTNTNTYTGGTIITAGALQLGNGGTTGSILGNVTDNAVFAINHSDAVTFGNVISGTGAFQQVGTGTTTLTNTNTYSGGTTIAAGMLQLGNGGTTGSIIGNVTDNAVLAINHSDAVTFGGVISGTGVFQQNGTGTTDLTAINSYTGTTTVNGGILQVDGSIASSSLTTVNANTALTGSGTVGNTLIASGAMFAPGSGTPGSFMTVSGNLAFQSGAQYLVELNPTTSSFTSVTGTATLGNATVDAVFANGSYVTKRYTIVTAGNISGTFSGLVNTNLPSNFHTALNYDATHAFLDLILNFGLPTAPLNGNQQSVGNALSNFFNTNGSIPMIFGALSPAGLTQAAGETATGSQQTTINAMNQFMGLLTDPFIAGRGDPVSYSSGPPPFAEEDDAANAYAAKDKPRSKSERDAYAAIYRKAPAMADILTQRWSVWAAGYGGSQTTDGNAAVGSNTATSRIFGGVAGADYRFSPYTLAGFALAGGGTNFSIANGLGTGRSDLFQAGAYLRHTNGPAYISAALAYGWQDITTDRTVTIAGVDQLRARFNANAFSGRAEGGYRFVTPWVGGFGITPYAAAQFTTFDLPAYAERAIVGANTFALAYGSKSVTDTRSELGIRTDKSWAMQNAILTLRSRFAWAHDFNPDRNIAATFQTLPGASFVVNGAAQSRDAALTTASAEVKWMSGWSAAATFEGEFSNVTRSYAGKGVVRYQW